MREAYKTYSKQFNKTKSRQPNRANSQEAELALH